MDNYEQKYKKALERAKALYAKDVPDSLHLESIFPELKEESEDERIRKELIAMVRLSCTNGDDVDKKIAWLEKQGKETNWKPSKEEMSVLYGLAYITNQYDEHKEEVITRLYQDLKREFFNGSNYENMFPNTEDGVRRRSTIQVLEYARSLDTYNQYGKADIDKNIAWLEGQGKNKSIDDLTQQEAMDVTVAKCFNEQKPIDNVEPKFHEGEWITNSDYTWQIVSITDLDYILQSQDGNIVDDTISHVDEQFHSFTIKDAKDGDVLTYNDSKNNIWVCIFKEYANERVYDYCTLDKESFWEHGNWNYLASFSYTPATKEQRDTLLKAMANAGYTFDFEKKELKKIEQKPTDEEMRELLQTEYEKGRADAIAEMQKPAEWHREDEQNLNACLGFIPDAYLRRWLKDIIHVKYDKTAWSEEDEKHVKDLVDYFTGGLSLKHTEEDIANWLKSLKDRVQTKQEWSEEDESLRRRCIGAIDMANLSDYTKDSLLNWLKSLSPQSRWKPSNEQVNAFDAILVYNPPCSNECRNYLITLYNELKKLKGE